MFLLPRKAASLANLCSSESIQYTLTGVHVKKLNDDHVQVQVSDGKCAARVTARTPPNEDFPSVPNFTPNGQDREVVIDAKEFKKYVKHTPRKHHPPICSFAAVNSSDEGVTIATTDLSQGCVTALRPIEGRFPDIGGIIPKSKPEYTIYFNAELLAKVLTEAAKYSPEGLSVVRLDFTDPKLAAKITTKNEDGEEFIGVVMPVDASAAKGGF